MLIAMIILTNWLYLTTQNHTVKMGSFVTTQESIH